MSSALSDAPPPKAPTGHPVIAWGVIVTAVAWLLVLRAVKPPAEVEQMDNLEIQGRSLVGARSLAPKPPAGIYEQALDLNRGPAGQRLRFVVLAGELKGPKEALDRLRELTDLMDGGQVKGSDDDRATAAILERLYRDYDDGDKTAKDVDEDDRKVLRDKLGWFGDLALAPAGGPDAAARSAVLAPALRAVTAGIGIMVVGIGAGMVGLVLIFVFVSQWRWLRSGFVAGSPYGGVYAETFAVWMLLFIGLSFAGAFIPKSDYREFLTGLAALGSLAALGWPVLRGVQWRRVRQDVGLHFGRRPGLEPLYGFACYLCALPLVIVCALALAGVIKMEQKWGGGPDGAGPTPTHPIVDYVIHAGWWGRFQALFLASFVAPLLEETMFRGVLYRHLREASDRQGRVLSVLFSGATASFVFAVLHPQGILAVPVLMSLAFGFSAAREWRGSLVPSMTVHALHNGMLLLLLLLTAG